MLAETNRVLGNFEIVYTLLSFVLWTNLLGVWTLGFDGNIADLLLELEVPTSDEELPTIFLFICIVGIMYFFILFMGLFIIFELSLDFFKFLCWCSNKSWGVIAPCVYKCIIIFVCYFIPWVLTLVFVFTFEVIVFLGAGIFVQLMYGTSPVDDHILGCFSLKLHEDGRRFIIQEWKKLWPRLPPPPPPAYWMEIPGGDDRTCVICLAEGAHVAPLCCGSAERPNNIYHPDCLRTWWHYRRNNCPWCRVTF